MVSLKLAVGQKKSSGRNSCHHLVGPSGHSLCRVKLKCNAFWKYGEHPYLTCSYCVRLQDSLGDRRRMSFIEKMEKDPWQNNKKSSY